MSSKKRWFQKTARMQSYRDKRCGKALRIIIYESGQWVPVGLDVKWIMEVMPERITDSTDSMFRTFGGKSKELF